jgi:hypothetical protein
MPWDPLLFSGPAPAPLERSNQAYSLLVAADNARAEREKGDEVATPETDAEGADSAASVVASPSAAPNGVVPSGPPSNGVAPHGAAPAQSTPPATESPTPSSTPSASLKSRPSTSTPSPASYASSPADTRRRLDNYKQWLAQQALMRLDTAMDQPSFMSDSGADK